MLRAFFCFLALIVPVTAFAAGAPFRFVMNAAPQAPVAIHGVVGLRQTGTSYECVTFTNSSAQPITRVVFRFTYYDAAREDVGTDTFDRVGRVDAGARSQAPVAGGTADLWHNANCQHFKFPRQGISYDVVSVDRVEFGDGTAWVNPSTTPLSADGLVAILQPHVIVANIAATHVKMLGARLVRFNGTDYQCLAFENDASAGISLARFKLFYLDIGPKDGGTQVIDVRSNIAPGAKMSAMLPAATDPSAEPNCAPLKGDRANLEMAFLALDRVEYADGTHWALSDHAASSPSPSPSPSPSATP